MRATRGNVQNAAGRDDSHHVMNVGSTNHRKHTFAFAESFQHDVNGTIGMRCTNI